MAARESEIEMTLEILDEVAFLFVEQFDNLYGMLVDRTDVKRIRKPADDGDDGLTNDGFQRDAPVRADLNVDDRLGDHAPDGGGAHVPDISGVL